MSTCLTEYKSNDTIVSLQECKVHHILSILRNSKVLNSNKTIVDGNYKHNILSYFEEQMIDGQQLRLHLQNKKQFAGQISIYLNTNKTYGASMALLREFSNIDFESINIRKSCSISTPPLITQSMTEHININEPISFPDYIDKYTTLKNCDCDELEYIFDNYIFEQQEIKQNLSILENKQQILSYFRNKHINGDQVLCIKRSNFMTDISQYCDNKKLKAPLGKLFKILHNNGDREYRILISDRNSELSESGEETKEEEEFHVEIYHIIYVIKNHIFKDIKYKIKQKIINENENEHDLLEKIKIKIIEYFEINQINGSKLKVVKRLEFAKEIAIYIYDKSLTGIMAKLYNELVQFEWSNVDWNIDNDNDNNMIIITPPTSIKECNTEQMVYLLSNHIFPIFENGPLQKRLLGLWQKHKNNIIAYFKENRLNGADIMSTTKRSFSKSIADKVDKLLRTALFKLHETITDFKFDDDISSEIPLPIQSKKMNEMKEEFIPKEIKECNCIELMFILNNYILKDMVKQYIVMEENELQIMSYFEDRNMNGSSLVNMNKADFAKKIVDVIGNKKLTAPLRKLYTVLTNGNETYDVPLQFDR